MTQGVDERTFDSVIALLACPHCRGDLARDTEGLHCRSCSRSYPLQDGIPLLARPGSSEHWGVASDGSTSAAYQEQFLKADIGERYRQRYQRAWSKRCTTQREIHRLERLLGSQPRCARLLDLPCGGGRVSGSLAAAADFVLQADLSLGQVLMARQTMGAQGRIAWFTASAFLIPLKDGAVDGVVCNRLTHHLTSIEQERLVRELLRVSARFVILSYYDHRSFRSLGRRIRGKPPGHTMRRENLQTLAQQNGASLQADIPLWCSGSRLRYALLRKRPG